jgi:DNA-damage-inducible protein D
MFLIVNMPNNIFEQIKRVNESGEEYWSARELCKVLGYGEYRYFFPVIDKARDACKASQQAVVEHFVHAHDMFKIAAGRENEAIRKIDDFHLTRYACYLIAQNGDPRKEEIALAQTYFAFQTHKQELYDQQLEDSKRVALRGEMALHNKKLAKAATKAGVIHHANFQDAGYMGLYGNLRQKDIHKRKKLKPNEKILDHMGSEELAANLFRATQTESKLRRENIYGENQANKTHFDVGKKVRKTIKELGGTMPEILPSTEDIKGAKKRLRQSELIGPA